MLWAMVMYLLWILVVIGAMAFTLRNTSLGRLRPIQIVSQRVDSKERR